MVADSEASLQARIADLERELAEERRAHEATKVRTERLRGILYDGPLGALSVDREGKIIGATDTMLTWIGYASEELLGQDKLATLVTPESLPRYWSMFDQALKDGTASAELALVRKDGSVFHVTASSMIAPETPDKPLRCRSLFLDVTERKLAEEAQHKAALQEETIHAQEQVIAELSCPLLTVAEGVLVMPLIGAIDTRRATRMQETLLSGIASSRARVAILDITGVGAVDMAMAEVLVRTARSVRLLGAEVVLTGIRPEVARALVDLHAGLEGLTTRGNLESGITYAIGDRARRAQPMARIDALSATAAAAPNTTAPPARR